MDDPDKQDRRGVEQTVATTPRRSPSAPSTPSTPSTPSATSSRTRSTPFQWGPLEVVELLGAGSFGDVYRAHDPRLARDVALKLRRAETTPAGGGRSLDEARRLARVRHPNVLTIFGADVHDGLAGFWTDLVAGRTLELRVRTEGPVAADEAMRIGSQLCRALAAVHAAGMVHGDVTTANVMEDGTGTVLLMDFGAVTERHMSGTEAVRANSNTSTRSAGSVIGTPIFMAPELLRGGTPTPSTDLYSLAVLLFRLVSGSYPVEATSIPELIERHAHGKPRPAREAAPALPGWLADTLDRALAPDPRNRFPSALELERALAGSQPSPSNLPAPITSFIGREALCREITDRLSGGARLVTLTGAGGSGKTRLAIEVAGRRLAEHPGGVWLVDLASIADPARVPFEVARMIGVREVPGGTSSPALARDSRAPRRSSSWITASTWWRPAGIWCDISSGRFRRYPFLPRAGNRSGRRAR